MANKFLKCTHSWVDLATELGVTLTVGKTYVIGIEGIARVYAKSTTPDDHEGFIVNNDKIAYTHESGNKLWVRIQSDFDVNVVM